MARKPLQTENQNHAVPDDQMPGLPAAMQNLALSADLEKDEILNAGIDLGRLDAMVFVATMADSAILSIYENVKKSKAWRNLRNSQSCHGGNFESLDEFCQVKLGRSYRRLQAISGNRKTLGDEAFDQAERIGLRQADYDLIKVLPAPKQEIIKEALSEGATKEDLQKAIRELAAADQKEIEELTKRVTEVEANYEQQGELISRKDDKINDLEMKLRKQRVSLTDWPAEFQGFINQVMAAKKAIEVNAGALDIIRTDAMSIEAAPGEEAALEKARESLGLELSAAITRAEECIAAVRHVFDKTLGALIEE